MRISDWSSDVCSSDLVGDELRVDDLVAAARGFRAEALEHHHQHDGDDHPKHQILDQVIHSIALRGNAATLPDLCQLALRQRIHFRRTLARGSRLADHHLGVAPPQFPHRSEEPTSELQSLTRTSYAVFCLNKKKIYKHI